MHPLDFFSESPKYFIFQKEVNKTNFGGVLTLFFGLIMIFISFLCFLDFIDMNSYSIEYSHIMTSNLDKDIPYFAINVPNDTCLDCGYTDEFNDKCPMCESEHIQQLRRVTGYLTGDYKTAFNFGKQQETELRFKHSTLLRGYK